MMPEPFKVFYDTFNARMTALERDNADMQRALDLLDKDWRKKIAPAVTGAAGTMTPKEDETVGYVTPNTTYGANIRYGASTAKDNPPLYRLEYGQTLGVDGRAVDAEGKINPATGKPFVWYMVLDGDDNFVREDVVTFTPEHIPPSLPVAGLNATIWPAPCRYTAITNRHGDHGHNGIDFAASMGTPVLCGPNGGHVVRVFECVDCKPDGDGGRSYNDPKYGMGYGTHVVVRYENAHLTPTVKALIPKDAFLFCMYAHLSLASVRPSVMPLDPYQEIGRVGSTGNSSGPHLHFECCYSEYAGASWGAIIGNQVNPNLLVKA